MLRRSRAAPLAFAALTLVACGGGGGSESSSTASPPTPVADFPLHTLTVEWPQKASKEGIEYINAKAPVEKFDTFWDFCAPNCVSGPSTPVTSAGGSSTAGSFTYSSSSGFPQNPPSVSGRMVWMDGGSFDGKSVVRYGGIGKNLSVVDSTLAVGQRTNQVVGIAAITSRVGNGTLGIAKASADFSTVKVPDGWAAKITTVVVGTISSGWTDAQGKPQSGNIEIYNQKFDGAFVADIPLNATLGSFPALQGETGLYSLRVQTDITLRRTK